LIGGIVGGVCGIGILVLILMLLLKWKRRQGGGGLRLLADGGSGGVPPGGPSALDPGGGVVRMMERAVPFAIPSTLASLAGHKRASQVQMPGSESSERGFYRVSGKKLTSVLQSGGDGYSDPHDSIRSRESFYRDSQGFFAGPGTPPLRLGSPMRPESGIMVMREGPARTPVQERGPFDDHQPSTPPIVDPIGRTRVSQDGSRFTEDL
jgi:hypothetical protein